MIGRKTSLYHCECRAVVKYSFCPDCARPKDIDNSVTIGMAYCETSGRLHSVEHSRIGIKDLGEIDFGKESNETDTSDIQTN